MDQCRQFLPSQNQVASSYKVQLIDIYERKKKPKQDRIRFNLK